MIAPNESLLWAFYGLSWLSRIRGIFRRARQPHLRGEGWFLDVQLQPGFEEIAGRALMRGYLTRMAAPVAVEAAIWIVALATGHASWLVWLVIAMMPVIHLNHIVNVQVSERNAKAYALVEESNPVAAIGLSLTPRRLRDFTNAPLEWTIALATIAAFAWLLHLYLSGRFPARQLFWLPTIYLYLQLGVLLIKSVIVGWRSPIPMAQTAEHMEARNAMRRYYLWTCDYNRVAATLGICFWPLLVSCPPARFQPMVETWGTVWVVGCIILAVWTEFKRKQVAEIGVKARPVHMPSLMDQSALVKWPLCYQPSVPMLVLQGKRGYSVNMANTAAYLALAYAIGMATLAILARSSG